MGTEIIAAIGSKLNKSDITFDWPSKLNAWTKEVRLPEKIGEDVNWRWSWSKTLWGSVDENGSFEKCRDDWGLVATGTRDIEIGIERGAMFVSSTLSTREFFKDLIPERFLIVVNLFSEFVSAEFVLIGGDDEEYFTTLYKKLTYDSIDYAEFLEEVKGSGNLVDSIDQLLIKNGSGNEETWDIRGLYLKTSVRGPGKRKFVNYYDKG